MPGHRRERGRAVMRTERSRTASQPTSNAHVAGVLFQRGGRARGCSRRATDFFILLLKLREFNPLLRAMELLIKFGTFGDIGNGSDENLVLRIFQRTSMLLALAQEHRGSRMCACGRQRHSGGKARQERRAVLCHRRNRGSTIVSYVKKRRDDQRVLGKRVCELISTRRDTKSSVIVFIHGFWRGVEVVDGVWQRITLWNGGFLPVLVILAKSS